MTTLKVKITKDTLRKSMIRGIEKLNENINWKEIINNSKILIIK